MQLLKTLSEAAGVPGREERIRAIIEGELKGSVDELTTDKLGNLIAVKRAAHPEAERLMLSAHMDEIGFIVKYIDDKGFLRVHNLGGFDLRNLFARQVVVHTKDEDIIGVLNPTTKPVHIASGEERNKVPKMSDLTVDLGLEAEDVKTRVRTGDMVTLRQSFEDLGAVVIGKALDDRASCWLQIQVLKALKRPRFDIHAVFSVQEEVGVRGATTSAFAVEPDIGIALDTTLAVDTPGNSSDQSVTELGKGVALKVLDSRSISTRWLLDEFIALAETNDIPHQLEVLPLGGTDAGAMQLSRAGVPSLTVSIPSRYVHTVTEMVSKADLKAAQDLLLAYLES